MNILGIGELALNPLPGDVVRRRLPKLEPTLLARQQDEAGRPVVFVIRRGTGLLYKMSPAEWQLLQLFDGKRSYAEIADEYLRQTGIAHAEDQVRQYAELRQRDSADLFYRSPAEKNIARLQALRNRRQCKHEIDFSDIRLWQFDPSRYLNWLNRRLGFVFTPAFTVITLVLWGWMVYEWVLHWGEIWNDSIQYFNYTNKGFSDLIEFWILFLVVAAIHETAHGLTTTHWGGESHQMGFMLMWMGPTFFCDCSEIYVYGGKWERIGVSVAGMWSELLLSVLATAVWLSTAPGMVVHDIAYKLLLVGGIFLIVLNLNPLIKLDGYFIFTDLIGFPDLKEDATSYVSNWTRKLFGLPHHLPSLRLRHKVFYFVYALLSGAYSYALLLVISIIGYHIARRFWPEWAFVPAAVITYFLFQSRSKRLGEFMRTVYVHNKNRWKEWLAPRRAVPLAGAFLVVLFAPVWRDTVHAPVVLEPAARAIVRAAVPGKVLSISAREGDRVAAGQGLGQLRDLPLEGEAAQAEADYQLASARAVQAERHYVKLAVAKNDLFRADQQRRTLADRVSKLRLVAPVSGIVVTPRPQDLVGSYVQAGSTLLEVADPSRLRARIYIPDAYMRDVRPGAPVSLEFDGNWPVRSTLSAIAPSSEPVPAALSEDRKYKGLGVAVFYTAFVDVPSTELRDGMRGEAKILVTRRSVAGLLWRTLADAAGRRIW